MVTIVDPTGTPVPVYNRDGATVETIVATGTSFGTAAQINRFANLTIVIADCTDSTDRGLILPSDAEIGDAVEVYPIDYFADVYPSTGDTINGSSSSLMVGQNDGKFFRKISATAWRTVS